MGQVVSTDLQKQEARGRPQYMLASFLLVIIVWFI